MIEKLAELYRGDFVESIHYGIALHGALAADGGGFILKQAWGDPSFKSFARSLIKPIQIKILLDNGLDLNEEEIAVACSSHKAQEQHLEVLRGILAKYNLQETDLLCPGNPSPIHHNCSGKHAAMLALSKLKVWDLKTYLQAEHPVQSLIIQELKALCPDISCESDSCGVPSFYMSLEDMARALLFSLSSPSYLNISHVMNRFSSYIPCEGSWDSVLMSQSKDFIVKGGAEGLIFLVDLSRKEIILLKIIDGSDRAKGFVLSSLAQKLGWLNSLGEIDSSARMTEQFRCPL